MESMLVSECDMKDVYDVGLLPEVDGALLMELLEDAPPDTAEDGGGRLDYVIRSLEAELGGGGGGSTEVVGDGESTTGPSDDGGGGGGLEDVLSELGSSYADVGPFEWPPEMAPAVGHDVGGWYADGEGAIGGYEPREYYAAAYYTYCPEAPVEQVYSPLWE